MSKLEELEAIRAAAVNAADADWDDAVDADAAYATAWDAIDAYNEYIDAIDAYKAELDKQEDKTNG